MASATNEAIALYIVDSSVPRLEADLVEKAVSLALKSQTHAQNDKPVRLGKYSVSVNGGNNCDNKYTVKRVHLQCTKHYPVGEAARDVLHTSVKSDSHIDPQNQKDETPSMESQQLVENLLKDISAPSDIDNGHPSPFKLSCSLCSFEAKTVQQFKDHISGHAALHRDFPEVTSSLPYNKLATSRGHLVNKLKKRRIGQPYCRRSLPFSKTKLNVGEADPSKKDESTSLTAHTDNNTEVERINFQNIIEGVSGTDGHQMNVSSLGRINSECDRQDVGKNSDTKLNSNSRSNEVSDKTLLTADPGDIHSELSQLKKIKHECSPRVKACPRSIKAKLTNEAATSGCAKPMTADKEIIEQPIVISDCEDNCDVISKFPQRQLNEQSGDKVVNNEDAGSTLTDVKTENHNIIATTSQIGKSSMVLNSRVETMDKTLPKVRKDLMFYFKVIKERKSPKLVKDKVYYFPVRRGHRCIYCNRKFVQEKHLRQHTSLFHE